MEGSPPPNLRDYRRRRLLLEISGSSERKRSRRGSSGRPASVTKTSPRYPPDLVLLHQPRLTDVLPSKPLTVILIGFLGLVGIGTIVGVEWTLACLFLEGEQQAPSAFDPEATTSLGGWLSSILLFTGAVLAFALYTLRKHRRDDFRGTYRIWVWVAIACLFLSIEEATALMKAGERLLAHATGQTVWQDMALWWLVPFGLFFVIIASRLYVEFDNHWSAKGLFIAAGAFYLASWIPSILQASGVPSDLQPYLSQVARMIGHLLIVLAIAEEGRQVAAEAWAAVAAAKQTPPRETTKGRRQLIFHAPHSLPQGWHGRQFGQEESFTQQGPSGYSADTEGPKAFAASSRPEWTEPGPTDPGESEIRGGQRDSATKGRTTDLSISAAVTSSSPTSSPWDRLPPQSSPGSSEASFAASPNSFPKLGWGGRVESTEGEAISTVSPADSTGSLASSNQAPLPGCPTGNSSEGGNSLLSQLGLGASGGVPRKLTKAEKKAIRKRLEELRAAREKRLQEKQQSEQRST